MTFNRPSFVAALLALAVGGWCATADAQLDLANLHSEAKAGKLSLAVEGTLERVYVPNRQSNSVSVIDPATLQVVDTFKVGRHPQHVVVAILQGECVETRWRAVHTLSNARQSRGCSDRGSAW